MSTLDPSCEKSAKYYDSVYATVFNPVERFASLGPDATFYEDLARDCGRPVLELGCGTGRVLLRIAQNGIRCCGIDRSPAMLARFREKPGADKVELVQASMTAFALEGRRFPLIYSAFRAFQHLNTVQEQLDCLAQARAHLTPGGLFAFDVFHPRLEKMAVDEDPESLDVEFIHAGKPMKRFAKVKRDRVTQITEVTFRYEGDGPDTNVSFTMRWFWRFELEHLLNRAGFSEVTIYGDFDPSPVRRNSPTFVVVAHAGPGKGAP